MRTTIAHSVIRLKFICKRKNNFMIPVVAEENTASKALCFATSKIIEFQINVSLTTED